MTSVIATLVMVDLISNRCIIYDFSYSIPQALLVLKIKCIFYAAKVHFFYEKGHNKLYKFITN